MICVQVTRNFKRNLDSIQEFLAEIDAGVLFERLLDDLFEQIIPALTQFPELGADFFRHAQNSHEVILAVNQLRKRIVPKTRIRELIHGDFLLLYAQRDQEIYLLSIKHHRQLSFDLHDHWLR